MDVVKWFIAFILGAQSVGTDSQSEFNVKTFSTLNEEERFEVLYAALKERDAWLSQFTVHLSRTTENVFADGRRVPFSSSQMIARRRFNASWLHDKQYGPDGQPDVEFIKGWDGISRQTVVNFPTSLGAVIDDREPGNFADVPLFHILGYRGYWNPRSTLSDWLAQAKADGWIQSITLDSTSGIPRLRVSFRQPKTPWFGQYFFDPQLDWACVLYTLKTDTGKEIVGWQTQWADKFEKVCGLWIPTHVVKRLGNKVDLSYENEFNDWVTFVSFTPLDESELHVNIPLGTEIVNFPERIAYRISPNGSRQFLPMYNSATGEISVNGEIVEAPGRALADNGTQMAIKSKDVTVKANGNTAPGSLPSRQTAIFAGAGLMLFACAVHSIRRRTAT